MVGRAHSGRQRRTQQAGMVSEATLRVVSGAMVRQADNRDHAGIGMLTEAQSVVHRDWRVSGATLRQGSHWGHTGPNIQGTHTLAERSVRGTLGQAWSVGATRVVGSVESHPGWSAGGQWSQRPHLSQ